ncbi:LysM peptidoglycan-binding domain-containing protein, partial [Inquilinus limosus]|uniref:LysM peptidoglycan-binding domain-containing protein n=1 Tax=Inquilinus limosus TaxID=171674 RepID=UPI003F5CF660
MLSIVRRYDVSMPALIALNGLQPPYALQPGQTLRLPGAPGSAPGPAPTVTLPSAAARRRRRRRHVLRRLCAKRPGSARPRLARRPRGDR